MKKVFYRAAVFVVLTIAMVACSTPRGAGFQKEVLAASGETTADGAPIYDFSVYEITQDTLHPLAHWPRTGSKSYSWINRQIQPASLLIAAGDMLQITVWDAEDNSLLTAPGQRAAQLQNVRVSSSGRIFLPFVGDMKVSGMSPDTARSQVEARLIETVPSAQVQLNVEAGRANTANLVAGARTPGVYPLVDRNVTVLDLISMGGGIGDSLTNPQIRLMRGNTIYGTSIDRLYEDPALDTTLRGGDRVIVQSEERYFLSLGAAGREAVHIFPKDKVTALDALAIVGGISDARADPQGILILREYNRSAVGGNGPPMQRVVFTVDLTSADGLFSAGKFEIMPNDLVYATESPIGAALTVFGVLRAALSLSNAL